MSPKSSLNYFSISIFLLIFFLLSSPTASIPPQKVQVVFVVGGPGAGKGTQCELLVKQLGCLWLSTGDLLREYVKQKMGDDAEELGKLMKEGKLVSSERLVKVIKVTISSSKNKYILLDGFPRNQENIDVWNKMMTDVADVIGVLYLDASEEVMMRRLLNRNQGRDDDTPEIIKKRISIFKAQSQPIIDLYEKEGILMRVDSSREYNFVNVDVINLFKKHHIFGQKEEDL